MTNKIKLGVGVKKIITKISFYAAAAVVGIGRTIAQTNEIINPIDSDTFEELMVKITYYLFLFSIPIVSIMVLYGGFQMMAAAGDPGKIENGKRTITYAVWGFVAVILAMGAASVIKELIGVAAE